MRAVFGLVLIAGVALAGFAVYQTNLYITRMQNELVQAQSSGNAVEMVNIIVAGQDLVYGQRITRNELRRQPFPASAMPAGAFTDEELDKLFPNGISERVVLRAMDQREPILASKLTEPGKEAGITSHLSPGMRAFTIPVNATTGVAGFLRPGDRVDVFWTGRSANIGEVTQLIQSNLRLIAVDQNADMDRTTAISSPQTVTVEATPGEAAKLAQAQSSGRLALALLGAHDLNASEFVEVTQDRMLGIVREQEVEIKERECHVRTRRGNEMVLIEIPCTN